MVYVPFTTILCGCGASKKLAEKMPIYFEHFKRESIKIIRSSSFAKNTKEISHTVSTNHNVFFVVRTN